MKKILCLLSLTLTLTFGWSQINEKDTVVTTISAAKASVQLQVDIFPDYINLQWTKGADDFTGHFELYRSADGVAYNIVKLFEPTMVDANQRYFSYRDEDPLRGKNFYRLVGYDKFTQQKKQVDIVAEFKNIPRKVSPTLVTNGNQLNILNYDGEEMELCLYTSAGSPLLKKLVSSSVINLSDNVAKGLYVYQLVDRKQLIVSSGKIVLQ